MPNIIKKFLLHFYVLNSFYMVWAQVVRAEKPTFVEVDVDALQLQVLYVLVGVAIVATTGIQTMFVGDNLPEL